MKGVETSHLLPRYAFWDVDLAKVDLMRDKAFVISRIFERGKLNDVLSLFSIYGKDEIGKVLINNRYLTRSGLFLAHTLLGLSLEDFKAYALLKHS